MPFDMSAIRKVDGTAFFLPVLRQGGDASAAAVLDVEMLEVK